MNTSAPSAVSKSTSPRMPVMQIFSGHLLDALSGDSAELNERLRVPHDPCFSNRPAAAFTKAHMPSLRISLPPDLSAPAIKCREMIVQRADPPLRSA